MIAGVNVLSKLQFFSSHIFIISSFPPAIAYLAKLKGNIVYLSRRYLKQLTLPKNAAYSIR